MKNLITLVGILFALTASSQNTEALPAVSISSKGSTSTIMAAPANDNCSSATSLTPGSSLLCSQTTDQATTETGECVTNYAGATEKTVWYRFTATNDSLVMNFIRTNSPNCAPHIRVYGPFASGTGCVPACASAVYSGVQNGDPGSHILLTGLQTSGNNQYLIQIQGNSCGGPGASQTEFCINLKSPASNAYASGATGLNACGTAFAGTSNGGYWNNGTGSGFSNFDNNAGTTCSGCTAGADSPFIINNVSWFNFCSNTAGTWQITVNGISGCTLPSPNQGIQASVLTGTTTAFVNQGNSQNPIPPGGTWTSPVITVNAGSCAWLMIDGFAGDACNYNVTLTNVSGGCIVLPIEISNFSGYSFERKNILEWITLSETNNAYFSIEASSDGVNWILLSTIPGAGNSHTNKRYTTIDDSPKPQINYYRLKQTDADGRYEFFKVISIDNRKSGAAKIESVYDFMGMSYGSVLPQTQPGIYIVKYNDGTVRKVVVQ